MLEAWLKYFRAYGVYWKFYITSVKEFRFDEVTPLIWWSTFWTQCMITNFR